MPTLGEKLFWNIVYPEKLLNMVKMGKLWVAFLCASSVANMNTPYYSLNSFEKRAEKVQCPISSI